MLNRPLGRIAVAVVLATTVLSAQAQPAKLKVGLISTLTGGGALLGEELKRGWDLGMDLVGGKIGGLDTEVIVGDDELKPDVAVTLADRMVKQQKVDVVAGVLWSNIMLAIYEPVTKANTIVLSTNAGPSQIAGKACSPLYISTSWQNDQFAEALAVLMNQEQVKNTFVIAPNYQAGKDIKSVYDSHFKGEQVGAILFKLGQSDFQSEFSEIRARKPQSVMAFAPGAMSVAFMKQWQALGMSNSMKLYTVNMIDYLTLPAMQDSAVGTYTVSPYDSASTSPANQKFVAAFQKKYNRLPTQYAMQAYDGVMLLDAGIRARKGNIADKKALIAAMRVAKLDSPRGPMTYNVNNFPIQNFYKIDVVPGPDGKPFMKGSGVVLKDAKDSHYKECNLTW